jgi:hypothetical protein
MVFDNIDCYSTEKKPFDLRYCSMYEVIHYFNDELDEVLEEKRCSLSIYFG